MTNAPGTRLTLIHSPERSFTCSAFGVSSMCRMVSAPPSVCAPERYSPGSGSLSGVTELGHLPTSRQRI